MTDNRRTATRHDVAIPSMMTIDDKPVDALMVNISLGGALVETGAKHAIGQRVHIKFHVPTQEDMIDVGATVRWADAKCTGVQFDGLRARDVWALNEYFKQLGS